MRRILFFLAIILFISGCAAMSSFNDFFKNLPGIKPSGSDGGKSYLGGKESINAVILHPSEGRKVSNEIPLKVAVSLQNDGESQAEGQACVMGLNGDVFEGSSCLCEAFSLNGKSRFGDETSEGDTTSLYFDEGTATIGEFTINDFSVTSIIRYDYKTYASIEGCVVKSLAKPDYCKPSNVKLLGVSSAPIQISSIKEELLPVDEEEYAMSLTMDITHEGNGRFFGTSLDKDSCNEDEENVNKRVAIRLVNSPGRSSCSPVVFKGDEKKATTTCVITGVNARDYKPLINVELSYAYEIRVSSRFEVA